MEVVRHVCPAAEVDQGTRPIRQMPLEHLNLGFTLGTRENHWMESHVQFGPDFPAFHTLPTSSVLISSPLLCRRLEPSSIYTFLSFRS